MSRRDAEAVGTSIVTAYTAAWRRIQSTQAALISSRSPKRAARQLAKDASDQMDGLDTQTRDWLDNRWDVVYAQGAIDADSSWIWDDASHKVADKAADDL